MEKTNRIPEQETYNVDAIPDLVAALEYWFDSTATAEELAKRARAALNKANGLE